MLELYLKSKNSLIRDMGFSYDRKAVESREGVFAIFLKSISLSVAKSSEQQEAVSTEKLFNIL